MAYFSEAYIVAIPANEIVIPTIFDVDCGWLLVLRQERELVSCRIGFG